ncbi:MAG: YitT family protein [Pseudomonadota bacterium]
MASDPNHHTVLEDVQGFLSGALLCALGVLIFSHLGLITGQTAGLALLIAYATGWNFGLVFFVLNIPFYLFSYWQMGAWFTVKSFIAVAILSIMTYFMPPLFQIASIQPLLGAVIGGALAGFGLIILFRHGGSLGGIGVAGLFLQDRTRLQAGWVQLCFDLILFATAFLILEPIIVLYSLIGAIVLNVSIAINHRKDRYIAH